MMHASRVSASHAAPRIRSARAPRHCLRIPRRSSSMVEDGARLRLPSADAATGAFTAELELDLGNLLAVDSRGPDPGAIQVRRCRATPAFRG